MCLFSLRFRIWRNFCLEMQVKPCRRSVVAFKLRSWSIFLCLASQTRSAVRSNYVFLSPSNPAPLTNPVDVTETSKAIFRVRICTQAFSLSFEPFLLKVVWKIKCWEIGSIQMGIDYQWFDFASNLHTATPSGDVLLKICRTSINEDCKNLLLK